jgi:hypothetical protein
MGLQSGSLQTALTDKFPGALDGHVTGMDVVDPTEGETISLLEVDDEFDVVLSWNLTGPGTTVVGGVWIVSLFSDDMDGLATSTMRGLIAGPTNIAIVPGLSPLPFQHRFRVLPPTPQVGLYKLTATINHSPTGNPAVLSEMFGYAEATPVDIRRTVVENPDN